MENKAFIAGIAVGINICQQKVVTAYDRHEPLIIGDKSYYILSGDHLLEEMIDEICR